MPELSPLSNFRFLYRQTEGVIDRATWVRASVPLVVIVLALTAIAWFIAPDAPRDLATQAFASFGIVAVHAYFLIYAFVLLMCLVAEYFVSAKRFTDLGKPQALAGFVPFALLIAGAAHWYQPRSEGQMPEALAWVFDLAALGVIAWNVFELGIKTDKTG